MMTSLSHNLVIETLNESYYKVKQMNFSLSGEESGGLMRAKAKIILLNKIQHGAHLQWNWTKRKSRESRDKNESVYLPTDSKIL
jgi:hypothetical protein